MFQAKVFAFIDTKRFRDLPGLFNESFGFHKFIPPTEYPLDSACYYRLCCRLRSLGWALGNSVTVQARSPVLAPRVGRKLAPALRLSAIESESEFVDVIH